ncbi:MAG: tRNA (adenosine(37)-N6)-threonylcarbamoyltransferase complex dimerization subunit type 1 TsaB [Clostridia bacterium]|nr:tRNA (adenosine(37)-N6)-threonylcarbamoyltransferase complex dimerization subunit type 1 TsaB [Clostridia bacterium]
MKILAVDSSAKSASAAVTQDEKLVAESFVNVGLTHSETLMPMIHSVLKNAGTDIKDIDAFCVTVGPGSFTGIRIGISAVKGLAQPRNKPCFGISTLDAMAYNSEDFNGIICCVMDARCSQVYNALYKCSGKLIKRLTPDVAISLEELYNILKEFNDNILLTGDGAQISYSYLKDRLANVYLACEQTRFQRAYGAVSAALKLQAEPCGAAELNPVYLRPSQAERELKKKKEN